MSDTSNTPPGDRWDFSKSVTAKASLLVRGGRVTRAVDGVGIPNDANGHRFDRWLAAHDAQVRADERERIAAAIRDSVPYGYGMNPDGTEDALAVAYVDGVRDACLIVKGEPTDSEES